MVVVTIRGGVRMSLFVMRTMSACCNFGNTWLDLPMMLTHALTMLLLHQCLIYTHFGRGTIEKWETTDFRVRRKCTISLDPT